MLLLTNFLITAVVMSVSIAYIFGIIALAEWVGDKWGIKGFSTVFGVLLFLPFMVLVALGMTYG